ncbi:MAG: PilZ domain-containing protein [Desulfobacterales bacterium]
MKENSSEKLQPKSSDIRPTEKERRRHERYNAPVIVELKGEAFNFVLQDISIGGFAFLTNEKFSNGKTLLISFGKSKQVQSEVIHQRNVVFDPVFIKNRYSIHCRFMTPILESDITNLFENITDFNIALL